MTIPLQLNKLSCIAFLTAQVQEWCPDDKCRIEDATVKEAYTESPGSSTDQPMSESEFYYTHSSLYPISTAEPTEDERAAIKMIRDMGKRVDDDLRVISYLRQTKSSPKKGAISASATAILRTWLYANKFNPYPTVEEKEHLMAYTGLKQVQLRNWFSNLRKRQFFPVVVNDEHQPTSKLQEIFAKHRHEAPVPKRMKGSSSKRSLFTSDSDDMPSLSGEDSEILYGTPSLDSLDDFPLL
jgi:hypothetical protein